MKKLVIALLLATACGNPPIPPIPPIGCMDLRPVCICDTEGHCDWQWECVER